MTHNLDNKEYFFIMLIWILIISALYMLISNVDAYTLNKAKSLTKIKTDYITPSLIVINKTQISYINNMKSNVESWAFQEGYLKAITDITQYLKIKEPKTEIISKNNLINKKYERPKICFDYYNGYFLLNSSAYRFENFEFNISKYNYTWIKTGNSSWKYEQFIQFKNNTNIIYNYSWVYYPSSFGWEYRKAQKINWYDVVQNYELIKIYEK